MKTTIIGDAKALAEKLGYVMLATVGQEGLPHITAAGNFSIDAKGLAEITEWFCPATVANLLSNKAISVVIWDPEVDRGYQLLGETERVEDLAILDGYLPGQEQSLPSPQVERKLVVRVDKILDFRRAPHSDIET